MRSLRVVILLSTVSAFAQQVAEQPAAAQPRLKTRTESPAPPPAPEQPVNGLFIVPAGTKIPIQLRQSLSTKNASPGDPVYAQTTFPIVVNGAITIPAGTYVKGVVDASKRAGRIKGSAELQFHLTTLIYPNGYSLDLAAAIDQVPGSSDATMKEQGTVKHDSEKSADLKRISDAAVTAGQIGSMAGAVSGSIQGVGVGGISGLAAGSLIALFARGNDVRFEIGSGVEVSLNNAIAVEADKVMRAGMVPASTAPSPVISSPIITVEK